MIRKTTYRSKDGFSVTGKDSKGRRFSIFCRLKRSAHAIERTAKNGEGKSVDRILEDDAKLYKLEHGQQFSEWRAASGAGAKRDWWVCCKTVHESPVCEKYPITTALRDSRGAIRRFGSQSVAQAVADKLNETL